MYKGPHFSVYEHELLLPDGRTFTRKFIVLKDGHFKRFTDFDKYLTPKNTIKNINSNGNSRFDFIIPLLNYLYIEKGITTLDDMSVEMIKEFLNLYGIGMLPQDKDNDGRKKETVETCVRIILDFLERFIKDRKGHCKIKKTDLYTEYPVRDKHGRTIMVKRPVFEVVYCGDTYDIFRDIPNKAFDVIFSTFYNDHKEYLGLVSLSAFAGLRPSEGCNVRRQNSPIGPGMIITREMDKSTGEDTIEKIEINLLKKYILRSDHVRVGGIKKKRMATVPPMFTRCLFDSINAYLNFITGRQYEAEFGPLNINRDGKCMTYDAYYQAFKRIIKNEVVPKFLSSDDPELVVYGQLVLEHGIAPHIFRHWYTVQLVLAGVDSVSELMFYRGDKSPESSLTYLNNKGEIIKKYKKVSDESFNYLLWMSGKKHVS